MERALADAAGRERGNAVIPSAVYGNGVEMDAAEARALLEWSQRPGPPEGGPYDSAARPWTPVIDAQRLATYARLGFVT